MKSNDSEFFNHNLRLPELTFRGILLGMFLTVIFTASNVYLGLKVGLTFSSAIPSAVISMAVLKMFNEIFRKESSDFSRERNCDVLPIVI